MNLINNFFIQLIKFYRYFIFSGDLYITDQRSLWSGKIPGWNQSERQGY